MNVPRRRSHTASKLSQRRAKKKHHSDVELNESFDFQRYARRVSEPYEATSIKYPEITERGSRSKLQEKLDNVTDVIARKLQLHTEEQRTMGVNRALFCVAAISLLWCTSLSTANSIVNAYIRAPDTDVVVQRAIGTFESVSTQQGQYSQCAKRHKRDCLRKVDLATQDGDLRALENQNYNQEFVLEFHQQQLTKCEEALKSIHEEFEVRFIEARVLPLVPTSFATCPPDLREKVKTDMIGDVTAISTQVNTATNNYQNNVNQAVDDVLTDSQRRDEYMDDFVDQLNNVLATARESVTASVAQQVDSIPTDLDTATQKLMACIDSRTSSHFCVYDIPFVQAAQSRVNAARDNSKLQADLFQKRVDNELDKMRDFIQVYNDISSVIAALYILPDPPTVEAIQFDYNFVSTDVSQMISDTIEKPRNDFNQAVNEANLKADGAISKVFASLNAIKEKLDEYFPPVSVNVDRVKDSLAREADEFSSSINTQLEEVERIGSILADEGQERAKVAALVAEEQSQAIEKSTKESWSTFAYPGFSITNLQEQLNQLTSLAVSFDVVFRVLQSFVLLRKYWRMSDVGVLPIVDLRAADGLDPKTKAHETTTQKLARLISHPGTGAGIGGLFLILFSILFGIMYSPFYIQFVKGCGSYSYNQSNGTMLTENAFSIAYQYALSEGEQHLASSISATNSKLTELCRSKRSTTTDLQLKATDTLNNLVERLFELGQYAQEADGCVRFDRVADMNRNDLAEACRVPIEYWNFGSFETAKTQAQQGLRSSIFNCTIFDEPQYRCEFDCTGPNRPVLHRSIHDSGCSIEWIGHSWICGFSIACLCYISLNVARVLFIRGVRKLYWEVLVTPRLQFTATCTRQGEMILPDLCKEKASSFEQLLHARVEEAISKFLKSAWISIALGCVVNVPWLILMAVVSSSLGYNP